MSKMDALRAMREARYAETMARAAKTTPKSSTRTATEPTPAKKTTAGKSAATKSAAKKPASRTPATGTAGSPSTEPVEGAEELCGHRNMSGRTCTRERGHAAKSHRYS